MILFAKDLALLADSEAELSRKLLAWRGCLESKGMKVNTGKTKVMVSTASAEAFETSGEFPCGVCRRGVGANSIQCTECHSWVHKRCSGILGRLSAANATFRCKRCRGEIPRPTTLGAGGSVVIGGETYEAVGSFCYLGDMIAAGGGAEAAVTSRIRSGWKKFRELAPFLMSKAPSLKMKGRVFDACVRSRMLYGSETWALTLDLERRMDLAEKRMIRRMCSATLRDRCSGDQLRSMFGLLRAGEVMRNRRLRWFGHVVRKDDQDWAKAIYKTWNVPGPRPTGRPRKTWNATLMEDLRKRGLTEEEAHDRARWKMSTVGLYPTH